MLYRPVFCCNCGERIVRDDWRLWTSRRFCALCASERQGVDLLPKVVVGAGLLAVVFLVASALRGPNSQGTAAAFSSQQTKVGLKPPTINSLADEGRSKTNQPATQNTNASGNSPAQINEQPQREKRTSEETVYYCGAITKKGTPCTRRVKTKGYCWQHAKSGQIAPARF